MEGVTAIAWCQCCVLLMTPDCSACMQTDIDEVNKIAHGLKARLDNLARANEAALKRPVCHPRVFNCCASHTVGN